MKYIVSLAVCLTCAFLAMASIATADIPTLMQYQGYLTDAEGEPLNDTLSMTFTIYDASFEGVAWWTETQPEVVVSDGLFNVLLGSVNPIVDAVFAETQRWLGITVASDPEIVPRTRLVTVPYAFHVATVDLATGGLIFGTVDADGFSINGVPVGTSTDSYWSGAGSDIYYNLGNVGIGTASPSEALDVEGNIHAGGTITSGSSITIDGTSNKITSTSGTIDFDDENIVTTGKATIGPGHSNTGLYAFVAGIGNVANGDESKVGGGIGNTASGYRSTIGAGEANFAESTWATIGGGYGDTAIGGATTVAGGYLNAALKWCATVGGGYGNEASGAFAAIDGGWDNRASGDWSAVGGGQSNTALEQAATVAGGIGNEARARESAIGGGWNNATDGQWSNISGGYANIAAGDFSFVGGGWHNSAEGEYSAILGGYADTITASADYSYLFGIGSKLDEDSTFMVDVPHIFFQGEIWQANSAGDTICLLSSIPGGGGFIGTMGANRSNNTGLTYVGGYPNKGALGVMDGNSDWKAEMIVSTAYDVGMIQTYGPNGNRNARLTYTLGYPNHGCVSITDSLENDRGHFYVNEYSAGTVSLLGPNGSYNVYIGNPNVDPNSGWVSVKDTNGVNQAGMYVDAAGQGIVWGDQKNFRIPNPNKAGTDIWYCSLEGPEAAAYVRGTGHLVSGSAQVTLPDHFVAVAGSQGITVQVTPLSAESKGLAVVEKSPELFAVRELNNGNGTYDFDFMVTAVRKGHEDYQVIRPALEIQPTKTAVADDESNIRLMKKF